MLFEEVVSIERMMRTKDSLHCHSTCEFMSSDDRGCWCFFDIPTPPHNTYSYLKEDDNYDYLRTIKCKSYISPIFYISKK